MGIKPVKRYGTNKVLPVIYDDSLSYYEVLCKLTNKLNEVIEEYNDNFETMVREQLDKLFINAMYDAETETLILILDMR